MRVIVGATALPARGILEFRPAFGPAIMLRLGKDAPAMTRRILIVKLSSLGDVIHTLPAALALRRRYPDAHLAWAVECSHAGVLRGLPLIDELIELDRGSWRGLFAFTRRLRT